MEWVGYPVRFVDPNERLHWRMQAALVTMPGALAAAVTITTVAFPVFSSGVLSVDGAKSSQDGAENRA